MKVSRIILALLLSIPAACRGSDPVYFHGAFVQDPGELPLRDELLTLPFKHVAWHYKYPYDQITRVTLGLEHLYLETSDNTLIAIQRHDGITAWKFHVDTGRPLEWTPVEAEGVPQQIQTVEERLRQNHVKIQDALKEKGPGATDPLWKERRQMMELLKDAQRADNLYFISKHVLFCLDRRSGNIRWKRRLDFAPSAQPFAIRQYVFVAGADLSRVWVLDVEKDGQSVAWFRSSISGDGKNHIMNQPVYSDPTLFFVSHDRHVYAYDVAKNQERWTYATEREIQADPVVHRFLEKTDSGKDRQYTFLLVGGMDNAFYAVDADGGMLQWKYECGGPIQDRAVVSGRTVYVRTRDGALFALDLNPVHRNAAGAVSGPYRSGKLRWKIPLGERFLLRGKNHVYVMGHHHTVYAVEEMSGTIHGRYPLNLFEFVPTNPVDEMFYAIHPAGYVFALRESKEEY